MANVTYQTTRWDVSVHPEGRDDAGHVCRVILGITATDSVSGKSSYKDETVAVHPCVPLAQFEEGAEEFIELTLGTGGWYLDLQTRIAAQLTAPVPAPSREMPDFASMNIGDGYQSLPGENEETAEEESSEEETPAEETAEEESSEEETPAEESSEEGGG